VKLPLLALAMAATGCAATSANPDGAAAAPAMFAYRVRGDAVTAPLGGLPGNAERGAVIVLDRREGNCLICHSFPTSEEPFQGDIGPPMAGIGARLSAGQIRLRLIDSSRINPQTIMPPYYRVEGLNDVAPEYRGRPALDAQQIEDVVAFLTTLTGSR
jgi:sulfur-oxidizing protein SoxX